MSHKPAKANRTFSVMRKMFNLAEVWGYRPEGTNPCRHVPIYPDGKAAHLISDEEMGKLFRYLDHQETDAPGLDHAVLPLAIRLQFEFAGRRSEIVTLQWDWVDLENRRMVRPDSKTGGMSKPLSEEAYRLLSTAPPQRQCQYYVQMASAERWSVRTLRERIDSMMYVRAVLSQQPGETIAQELATMRDAQRMSPALVMRDPYILDFLGLRDTWQEGDLEAAIIREMESFLLEPGAGSSFVARQKRIPIDDRDFHLDLLFYNRKLRRPVAVEWKVGEFKAACKGQMELYLRWLDNYEREPEEASPLGIILCTGKKREQIELLELDKAGIHVAEYLTALPSRALLAERLQEATERARLQIEQRES